MLRDPKPTTTVPLALLAALVVGTVGCSHVGQDEFDTTIAQVRREVRDGDESLSRSLGGRIDDVDGRVDGVDARVSSLDRDVQALAADFDVMVDRMETAMRMQTPIFFDYDDATLKTEDQAVLDKFGRLVSDYYPTALVTVEGFTDSSGSPAYNLALGMRRASSVRDYLVTYGQLAPDQVRAVSYGEDHARLVSPALAGPGDDGWENRRVVLVVDYGTRYGGQVAQTQQQPQP